MINSERKVSMTITDPEEEDKSPGLRTNMTKPTVVTNLNRRKRLSHDLEVDLVRISLIYVDDFTFIGKHFGTLLNRNKNAI